jgi:catechol 2,3-dioxygenase-like lactoylglutathione lyase family enzyme
MLDHVSIGVADLPRSLRFYDAALGALGIVRVGADDGWAGYGERSDADHPERCYLSLRLTRQVGLPAGRHWAFKAGTRGAVDAFWHAGLAAGGSDDGAPGLRPHYHADYYAAFLLDPDGNRVEAVCHWR